MWQIIRDLASDGVAILLTTQYLDEADQLADRIAVLDQGRIVAEGTPDELKSRIPGGHLRLEFADPRCCARPRSSFRPGRRPRPTHPPGAGRGTVDWLRDLLDKLHKPRLDVEQLSIHTPDLDDVFLAVTGSHVPDSSRATRH